MALELTSSKLARSSSTRFKRAATEGKGDNLVCDQNERISWTEKYRSKTCAELPVHHTKVRALRDWLNKAIELHHCYFDMGVASAPPCFLALCGNSGCCKTTTLELVCAEEKVEIVTWSEDQWEPQASSLEHSWMGASDRSNGGSNTDYASRWDGNGNGDRHSREGRESLYGMAVGKGYSSTARDLFKLDGVTPGVYGATKGAALEAFALQSRYPTLTMQTKHTLTGAAVPSSSGATSFTTTSTTAVLRPVAHTAESGSFQRKIILLKDPPGYEQGGSESQRQRLREMYAFVLAFQCPVVMVRSDVSGRDDFQFAADGSLPYHIRQRVQFESMYFTPITEIKVAKALHAILQAERLESGKVGTRYAALVQEIAASCMGDIRHAVLQLQLAVGARHSSSGAASSVLAVPANKGLLQRSQSVPVPDKSPISVPAASKRPRRQESAVGASTSSSSRAGRNTGAMMIDLTGEEEDNLGEVLDPHLRRAGRIGSNSSRKAATLDAEDYSCLVDTESDGDDDEWTGAALRLQVKPAARARRRAVIEDSDEDEDGRGLRTSGYHQQQQRSTHRDDSSDGDRERIGRVSSRPAPHILRGSSDGALSSAAAAPVSQQALSVFSEEPLLSAGRAANAAHTAKGSETQRVEGGGNNISNSAAVGKRDTSFSSLHSVSKLLKAKLDARGCATFDLDAVVEGSTFTPDLLLPFMQWNVIASIESTPRIYPATQGVTGTVEAPAAPLTESEIALLEIRELESALATFAEVDVYFNRKFDPNANSDRSGTGCYPDGYISAILCRSVASSRGAGSLEAHEYAKSRGYKGTLQGVFRPKVLDLRSRSTVVQSKLSEVQAELLVHQAASAQYVTDAADPVTGIGEGSINVHNSAVQIHHGGTSHKDTIRTATSADPYRDRASDTVIGAQSTVVTALSRRELLLNTIPYFQTIAHGLRVAAATSAGDGYSHPGSSAQQAAGTMRLPVYSERVDWLLEHVFSADSASLPALRGNTGAVGNSTHTQGQGERGAAPDAFGDVPVPGEDAEEEIGEFD